MPKTELVNLTKAYRSKDKEVVALKGISLDLNDGEIYVLLGPNGAGKTTLVKIICGILLPDEGEVFIDGKSVIKYPKIAREKVGVIFEEARNTYHYLTVEGNLKYFGYLNHVPKRILMQRITKHLQWLDLVEKRHVFGSLLSRGMQQKLSAAVAMIKDSPVLLLDDPTLGLDIIAADTIKDYLKMLIREEGKTILLTTHNMKFAEQLGDRFAFLHKGEIIWQGTKDELEDLDTFKENDLEGVFKDFIAR